MGLLGELNGGASGFKRARYQCKLSQLVARFVNGHDMSLKQFGIGLLPGDDIFKDRQGQVLHDVTVGGQFFSPGLTRSGFAGQLVQRVDGAVDGGCFGCFCHFHLGDFGDFFAVSGFALDRIAGRLGVLVLCGRAGAEELEGRRVQPVHQNRTSGQECQDGRSPLDHPQPLRAAFAGRSFGHAGLATRERVGESFFHQGLFEGLFFRGVESIQEGAHRFLLCLAFGLCDQLFFLRGVGKGNFPTRDVLTKSRSRRVGLPGRVHKQDQADIGPWKIVHQTGQQLQFMLGYSGGVVQDPELGGQNILAPLHGLRQGLTF